MRIGDICKRAVATARCDTPLAEVAKLMREAHVGSIVIVEGEYGGKPVGIVTDRDIVIEVVAPGLDPRTVTAGEIMTPAPAVANEDDDSLWALKIMRDRGVRRLPVVAKSGTLAGIVSLDDLLQHLGSAFGDVAQVVGTERSTETMRRH